MSSGQADHLKATIGRNIRLARDAKHPMTQSDLARLVNGGDGIMVSRWERGTTRPSDANLFRLAEVLGRDFAWFFTDHQNDKAAA
jgi:transcriptional regulator with XRE-family HTH domain